jgi:hypothetical protein
VTAHTIPILYSPGTYGAYLEWALTTLTSNIDIVEPFESNGSSHQFAGHSLAGEAIPFWQNYLISNHHYDFVRIHPKSKKEESISANIDIILENAPQAIYIEVDPAHVLLTINNSYYKSVADQWQYIFNSDLDPDIIYKNWAVPVDTSIDKIPNWIRREFLSFYLMPAWLDQVEWQSPKVPRHHRCLTIKLDDILNNFEDTLCTIKNFCELKFTKATAELIPAHNKMLSLQKYLEQDKICEKIIQSVIGNGTYDWSDQFLSFVSEVWIQWRLRELGYELRCHGLDKFPTNSVHLKELLYNI